MDPKNDAQNMDGNFYRAFEDKFRGTRDTIKSRLTVYLPFIETLKKIHDVYRAIDLGCGRGEWLEILTEAGMDAHGVDLDEGMLAACRERGLSVETADAISYLKSLPDESHVLVTGFHIIEHIPHNDVKKLIQEALRVLKPAGLFILETPNPENITVGTSSFYLDPTHINPIPPRLLAFISDYFGFHRTKILRLQEPAELRGGKSVNLENVFTGVSPDYSIVAQKKAESGLLENFDPLFAVEYGISMDTMLARYDIKEEMFKRRLDVIETETQNEINAMRNEINALRNETAVARAELNNIYFSRSWQITQPLRWLYLQIKLVRKDGLYVRSKAIYRRLFLRSNTQPNSTPSHETHPEDKDSSGHAIESSKEQPSQQLKSDQNPMSSPGIGGKFRQIVRSWLVSAVKLANEFVRRIPGIKRLAFRILRASPKLELKLRRYNQEGQSKSQLMARTWHATDFNDQLQVEDVPYTVKGGAEINSSLDGINTVQCTPLEANHHKYRKNA